VDSYAAPGDCFRHDQERNTGIRLPGRPRSADRTGSPAAVSQRREYFKYPPETIGDFSLALAKFGVWRPTANSQKPAIGGHFWYY
jgi:hypothetical protein